MTTPKLVRPTCGTCPHFERDAEACLWTAPVITPACRADRPHVGAHTPGCRAHPLMAAYSAEWAKRSDQTSLYTSGTSVPKEAPK